MLMRPKKSLDRLLTLKASGGHDLVGSITGLRKKCAVNVGMPARGPVTSFLSLRYRLQGFKVGADIPT